MKKQYFNLLLILLCVIVQSVHAQTKSKYDGIIGEYKITLDGETIKSVFLVNVFYVSESSLTVLKKGDKQNTSYNLADLKEVIYNEKKPGNQAGLWIGSILGAVVGGLAAAGMITEETRIEGNYEITETKLPLWPIYGGSLVGALIGGAISDGGTNAKVIYTKESGFKE